MNKVIIKVEGMSCEHCVKAVTEAVNALEGVSRVSVSLEEGTASIEYDPARVIPEDMKAAITGEGYEVA